MTIALAGASAAMSAVAKRSNRRQSLFRRILRAGSLWCTPELWAAAATAGLCISARLWASPARLWAPPQPGYGPPQSGYGAPQPGYGAPPPPDYGPPDSAAAPQAAPGYDPYAYGYGAPENYGYAAPGACDYYNPPWGYPPDYCNYQVGFDPVYVGGLWYGGPIYYRNFGGSRMFWLNGGWRRDEWRGPRPASIDWGRNMRWSGPAMHGGGFAANRGFAGGGFGGANYAALPVGITVQVRRISRDHPRQARAVLPAAGP